MGLVGLSDGRVLDSRERAASGPAETSDGPSLAERVAAHAPPSKPAATHPWRSPIAVAGSATLNFYFGCDNSGKRMWPVVATSTGD